MKHFMMSGELLTDRHVLSHGFPPLIDSYLKLANESKSTLSFHAYDGSTGRFTADNTYADRYKDRTDGILVEITDADIAYVQSLIDGASPMLMADGALMSIIGEEYSAYVSGAKSLDETVKLINDRVFTYISENN